MEKEANNQILNKITFPEFNGIRCLMMPFIQGDSNSLPDEYQSYSEIVENNYLKKGDIGFLTIDESYVKEGSTQRGYNSNGIKRNVHIEVGQCSSGNRWGGPPPSWGGGYKTLLDDDTEVLISNSIDNTCRIWGNKEFAYTKDGDLSHIIDKYPEHTGLLLKGGQLAKISIFTPHECVIQNTNSERQFLRIVGKGVKGREDHFTINPLMIN